MKIKCCSFRELADDILRNNKKIIMFGAGVIGQITTPAILGEYGVLKFVDCYLDNNESKWGDLIEVLEYVFEVKSSDYLNQCTSDTVILINISRYAEVKAQLEQMKCTEAMDVYIMPMMCIHNMCSGMSSGDSVKTAVPLIPKTIHYMWLGKKEIPSNLKKCIDSWKRYCPDYEIIEWNEDNYDFSKHPYMLQAYENKAYGFVPDYARLDILYNYGGFYLDTDVELLKGLDDMRYQEAFCGVEKWQVINFGGCSGAVQGHPTIKKFLDNRKNVAFIDKNGKQNKNTCGYYDTKAALLNGYKLDGRTQSINGINIYAYDFFHPYDYMSGLLNITENTRSIHHFNGGWLDEKMKEQNNLTSKRYLQLYRDALRRGK